jgi:hypothetical protein
MLEQACDQGAPDVCGDDGERGLGSRFGCVHKLTRTTVPTLTEGARQDAGRSGDKNLSVKE